MTEVGQSDGRTVGRRQATGLLRVIAIVASISLSDLPTVRPSDLHAQSSRRLDALLDAEPFRHSIWGVALVDERGKLLYGRNADRMFTPASNTKLVVTAVAAALLDPDFRVHTSLYGTGPVVDGVLQGDLVLYGRGDPAFGVRCYAVDTMAVDACDRDPAGPLRKLVDGLRARGIRTVNGAIVGDGSYFEPTIIHPAWDYYDTFWWYAAPVSGLTLNDNSVDISWKPGPSVGAPAVLTLSPDYHGLHFENRTRTVEAGGRTTIGDEMWRTLGTHEAWAEGTVALDHRGGTDYFAIPDPNLFAARAMRSLLAEAGISVTGETRATTDSLAYAHARRSAPLAEVASRPLRDWIFPILNTSQNLYAEVLLKQLGRQFGTAGSWAEGIRVERRFLIDSVGVDSAQFSVFDGSGLAAENLVSPLAFTQILSYMRKHPRWSTFAAGLPQSGMRGSLRTRFLGTPLEGRVRAKTGSISRVNTLSGYIETPKGRLLTFSIQANHHTAGGRAALARIDSIVEEMARGR
ncbi:MAG TPA: D-alanyl-D-alanine carboxypeptidase/D-alanyl-D-alanine-endopeptidase [Gemmatimonadales bacterium]|nr:D-alanyl-D-alanine carboxypeptidase/D-alanyl-D-alanine-endopeptidase [Gemmatimonadales bacterium]